MRERGGRDNRYKITNTFFLNDGLFIIVPRVFAPRASETEVINLSRGGSLLIYLSLVHWNARGHTVCLLIEVQFEFFSRLTFSEVRKLEVVRLIDQP